MEKTQPPHVNRDENVSVSTNLWSKPLPSSSFLHTLGLSPHRSDARLHARCLIKAPLVFGLWKTAVPPESTTEHLLIYSFIIEIDNVRCFSNKQAVTSPPPSAKVIKHGEAVLSLNNGSRLPFIPAYQGNFFSCSFLLQECKS